MGFALPDDGRLPNHMLAPHRIPSLTFATNSTGGYSYAANNNNFLCSGYLWSTSFDGSPVGDGTCGGLGAYCQEWDQPDLSRVAEEKRWDRFDRTALPVRGASPCCPLTLC